MMQTRYHVTARACTHIHRMFIYSIHRRFRQEHTRRRNRSEEGLERASEEREALCSVLKGTLQLLSKIAPLLRYLSEFRFQVLTAIISDVS